MNILHPVRAVRRIRAAVDGWVRSLTLRDAELYDRSHEPQTGVSVSPRTVMELDAVWSCVRLISETIATLPLSMYERTSNGGKRLASSHTLHFVIHDQPNVDSTASVFWEAMVASMLLRGQGRAEKLYVGTQLVGLAFLSLDRLVINRDRSGRLTYQYPRANGEMRDIAADRIWVIPGFTLDGVNGVSVVSYGAKVFGSAIAAEKTAAQTFRNGMLKTIYYKMGTFLKPDQRAEFKKNLMGTIERGESPLLEGGVDVGSLSILAVASLGGFVVSAIAGDMSIGQAVASLFTGDASGFLIAPLAAAAVDPEEVKTSLKRIEDQVKSFAENPTSVSWVKEKTTATQKALVPEQTRQFLFNVRGERCQKWYDLVGTTGAVLRRTFQDVRVIDPICVTDTDNHGGEHYVSMIVDHMGRKIHSVRWGDTILWTYPEKSRFKLGADGTAEFEYGGSFDVPGYPIMASTANVS